MNGEKRRVTFKNFPNALEKSKFGKSFNSYCNQLAQSKKKRNGPNKIKYELKRCKSILVQPGISGLCSENDQINESSNKTSEILKSTNNLGKSQVTCQPISVESKNQDKTGALIEKEVYIPNIKTEVPLETKGESVTTFNTEIVNNRELSLNVKLVKTQAIPKTYTSIRSSTGRSKRRFSKTGKYYGIYPSLNRNKNKKIVVRPINKDKNEIKNKCAQVKPSDGISKQIDRFPSFFSTIKKVQSNVRILSEEISQHEKIDNTKNVLVNKSVLLSECKQSIQEPIFEGKILNHSESSNSAKGKPYSNLNRCKSSVKVFIDNPVNEIIVSPITRVNSNGGFKKKIADHVSVPGTSYADLSSICCERSESENKLAQTNSLEAELFQLSHSKSFPEKKSSKDSSRCYRSKYVQTYSMKDVGTQYDKNDTNFRVKSVTVSTQYNLKDISRKKTVQSKIKRSCYCNDLKQLSNNSCINIDLSTSRSEDHNCRSAERSSDACSDEKEFKELCRYILKDSSSLNKSSNKQQYCLSRHTSNYKGEIQNCVQKSKSQDVIGKNKDSLNQSCGAIASQIHCSSLEDFSDCHLDIQKQKFTKKRYPREKTSNCNINQENLKKLDSLETFKFTREKKNSCSQSKDEKVQNSKFKPKGDQIPTLNSSNSFLCEKNAPSVQQGIPHECCELSYVNKKEKPKSSSKNIQKKDVFTPDSELTSDNLKKSVKVVTPRRCNSFEGSDEVSDLCCPSHKGKDPCNNNSLLVVSKKNDNSNLNCLDPEQNSSKELEDLFSTDCKRKSYCPSNCHNQKEKQASKSNNKSPTTSYFADKHKWREKSCKDKKTIHFPCRNSKKTCETICSNKGETNYDYQINAKKHKKKTVRKPSENNLAFDNLKFPATCFKKLKKLSKCLSKHEDKINKTNKTTKNINCQNNNGEYQIKRSLVIDDPDLQLIEGTAKYIKLVEEESSNESKNCNHPKNSQLEVTEKSSSYSQFETSDSVLGESKCVTTPHCSPNPKEACAENFNDLKTKCITIPISQNQDSTEDENITDIEKKVINDKCGKNETELSKETQGRTGVFVFIPCEELERKNINKRVVELYASLGTLKNSEKKNTQITSQLTSQIKELGKSAGHCLKKYWNQLSDVRFSSNDSSLKREKSSHKKPCMSKRKIEEQHFLLNVTANDYENLF